jgi:hypothetical protein
MNRCRLKSYLAGFVLAEIGCAVRVTERRYRLWKWSVPPWSLASPVIVGAGIGCGGRVVCRIREISTDVLVAGTNLVLRLTNAEADGWEHCLGPSVEIRCSCLKTFLQRDIEDALLAYAMVMWFCAVCLSSAGAGFVEAVSGRGVCGYTPIFPEGMVLRP